MIIRVLRAGDYSLSYERIVDICFSNAAIVNALKNRFKAQKKAGKVVRLTLQEFENVVKNYNHQQQSVAVSSILDVNTQLNIASPEQQTKSKTVVTNQQEIMVARICDDKPETKNDTYRKLFKLATEFAEMFSNARSEDSYMVPKAYQIYVACDIA